VIATTTDTKEAADAAAAVSYDTVYNRQTGELETIAEGAEDARVPVEESGTLADFRQSPDGLTVSYENPASERQTLIARLQEHAEDLAELIVDPELEAEPELGADNAQEVNLEAVRQAATARAIADGEAWAAQQRAQAAAQTPQQQAGARAEYQTILRQAGESYAQRMNQIKAQNPAEFAAVVANAQAHDVPLSPAIREALLVLPSGADAAFHLMQNPDQARAIANLPEHAAVAKIGMLAAQMAPVRRPVSQAPPPITPVSGSSTKSSVPLDEVPYQDYRRIRESQIRANRGRSR